MIVIIIIIIIIIIPAKIFRVWNVVQVGDLYVTHTEGYVLLSRSLTIQILSD